MGRSEERKGATGLPSRDLAQRTGAGAELPVTAPVPPRTSNAHLPAATWMLGPSTDAPRSSNYGHQSLHVFIIPKTDALFVLRVPVVDEHEELPQLSFILVEAVAKSRTEEHRGCWGWRRTVFTTASTHWTSPSARARRNLACFHSRMAGTVPSMPARGGGPDVVRPPFWDVHAHADVGRARLLWTDEQMVLNHGRRIPTCC